MRKHDVKKEDVQKWSMALHTWEESSSLIWLQHLHGAKLHFYDHKSSGCVWIKGLHEDWPWSSLIERNGRIYDKDIWHVECFFHTRTLIVDGSTRSNFNSKHSSIITKLFPLPRFMHKLTNSIMMRLLILSQKWRLCGLQQLELDTVKGWHRHQTREKILEPPRRAWWRSINGTTTHIQYRISLLQYIGLRSSKSMTPFRKHWVWESKIT